MKEAPFSVTLIILATLLVMMIAGGIWALILGSLGIDGFWGLFLSAFLTVPFGSKVRRAMVGFMARDAGVTPNPPMAFTLPIRLAISAAFAAAVAYVFNQSDFYSFGILLGAIAALITALCVNTIFYMKVLMGGA